MTTARRTTSLLLALAAGGGGCGESLATPPCEGEGCQTQVSWRKTYQYTVNAKLDVLFVVDDTPAISPYEAVMAAGLADIRRTLGALPQPASLHVGFVRAGACTSGTRGAACGIAAPEQFLRAEWCETTTNFSGTFADAFGCLGDLGAANCGPSRPLAAAAQALATPPPAGWEGFLRPEAYLLVVVIAAGDDASTVPASDVAAFIRGLKGDPSQTLASAIVPVACAASLPQRLFDFVAPFGANGLFVDLCDGQLAPALLNVSRRIQAFIDPACAHNVRDTDPVMPGLQPSCELVDHVLSASGQRVDSLLPSCEASAAPCWRLVPDASCGDGYVIDVERGPDWCAEAGENVTVECLGCAAANDPACAASRQSR